MNARSLALLPPIMGCALLSVNIVGSDPADVIFGLIFASIVLLSPGTLLFATLTPLSRIAVLTIVALYALSCTFGYRLSFIFYFISGLFLSTSFYFYTRADNRLNIGSALFGGFLIVNALMILIWAIGFWPGSVFFDLFRDRRLLGASGDPNFTGLMAAFALYFFLDRVSRGKGGTFAVGLNVLGLIASTALLLASQSRAAWAAAVVGLLVYLVASRQLFSMRIIGSGFAIVVAAMILSLSTSSTSSDLDDVSQRFRTIFVQTDSAEQERFAFVYTRAALAVAADHPLGVGPGMTQTYTGIASVDGNPIGAHNSYVEIATENGWLTAAIVFGLLSFAWFRLLHLARADVFFNDIPCKTILAGLSATAIFGMGHDVLGWRIGWLFPALAVLAAYSDQFAAFRTAHSGRR